MKISDSSTGPGAVPRAPAGGAESGVPGGHAASSRCARPAAPQGDAIVRNPSHPRVLHGLRYGSEIEAAVQRYGLDPKLLAAVAAQESGRGGLQAHDIDQPHGKGRGPFQIDVGAWPNEASIAHDPAKSADFAASLLRDGYRQADAAGDARSPAERTKEALRVYNGSSPHAKTTLTTWPDGKIPYETSVLRRYEQIEAYLASAACRR